MPEPFTGVDAKLDRADEHLAELAELLSTHLHDPDLVSGTIEWRAAEKKVFPKYRIKGLPSKVQVVIGDVVHNLRSALDHAAWQLVVVNGGTPGRQTQFPIVLNPPELAILVAGGVSDETLQVIRGVQPYLDEYRPDHPLAVLHYISIVDKHRELARGNHNIQNLVMWFGDHDPDEPWVGRITVGNASASTAQIRLVAEPGHEGPEAGGDATYRVQIEYSMKENSFRDLFPTLPDVASYVRDLVGKLKATLPRDAIS